MQLSFFFIPNYPFIIFFLKKSTFSKMLSKRCWPKCRAKTCDEKDQKREHKSKLYLHVFSLFIKIWNRMSKKCKQITKISSRLLPTASNLCTLIPTFMIVFLIFCETVQLLALTIDALQVMPIVPSRHIHETSFLSSK